MRFSLWEIERERERKRGIACTRREKINNGSLPLSVSCTRQPRRRSRHVFTHARHASLIPPPAEHRERPRSRISRSQDACKGYTPFYRSPTDFATSIACNVEVCSADSSLLNNANNGSWPCLPFGSIDRKLRAQIERLIHRDIDRAFSSRIFADSWKFDRVNVRLCRMLERFFRFTSLQ